MPEKGIAVNQVAIKVNGTDLSDEVMQKLQTVEVDSSLHVPDMFTLRFQDDQLDLLDGNIFNLGVSVDIDFAPHGGDLKTVIKGEITAIEPEFLPGYVAIFTVRGYDRSHRLHRGTQSKAFLESTDSDIAKKIAGEMGLTAKVDNTTVKYDHIFQHNQTNYEFLLERAQVNGFEVYVDGRDLHFKKPDGKRGTVKLAWGETLQTFLPRMSITHQVDEVIVRGWDPAKKQAIVGQAKSSSVQPQINVGGWGGAVAKKAIGSAQHIEVRRPVVSQKEADVVAKAILDEFNAGFVEAEGVAEGEPSIVAGATVELENLGDKFSGKYTVTSARHQYSPDGYLVEFTVTGARPPLMTDLMAGPSSHAHSSAHWPGVYIALVTNNDDKEGKQGRVKLKFPWLDEKVESDWARVAGVERGPNRGNYWVPEVNDEVLVAFEHGDFNAPVVIGSLYNGKDKPPEDKVVKNGKVEVRVIRTRAGHIIRMTDESGKEKIEIIDSKGKTSVTLDQAKEKVVVDSSKDVDVSGKGNITLKATQDVKITGTNITIDATSALKLNGMTVALKADTSLKAQGLNSDISGTAMLNLKGGMVNLN